jgi:hypothetical protein
VRKQNIVGAWHANEIIDSMKQIVPGGYGVLQIAVDQHLPESQQILSQDSVLG